MVYIKQTLLEVRSRGCGFGPAAHLLCGQWVSLGLWREGRRVLVSEPCCLEPSLALGTLVSMSLPSDPHLLAAEAWVSLRSATR